MRPAEFWRLTPAEFWWLMEAHKPVKIYGKRIQMTEAEVAEIYAETYGDPQS
jgi:hypothetical protein